jgi:hypothetical protein
LRSLAPSLVLIGLLLTTSACTAEPAPLADTDGEKVAGSLTELFERQLEHESDPFVVDVLERAIESGSITQGDYDAAHAMYDRCMSDLGHELDYERRKNGTLAETGPFPDSQDELDAFSDDAEGCAEQIAPIESLFATQNGNPELLADPETQVVRCLADRGLTPDSYDEDTFRSDLERLADSPFPFDVNSSEAQECFENAGFGIQVGS